MGGFCVGHWGTMEVLIRRILCGTLGHHGGSDWEDFVRAIGTPWRFRLGGFWAGHWCTIEVQIGRILCRTLGHHDALDWEDFVGDMGAP